MPESLNGAVQPGGDSRSLAKQPFASNDLVLAGDAVTLLCFSHSQGASSLGKLRAERGRRSTNTWSYADCGLPHFCTVATLPVQLPRIQAAILVQLLSNAVRPMNSPIWPPEAKSLTINFGPLPSRCSALNT